MALEIPNSKAIRQSLRANPLGGGGVFPPPPQMPQGHGGGGGGHAGPQHASSGRPDKGFLGFDANGGAPMNHMHGYHQPPPHDPIDLHKLKNQGLSNEAALTEAQRLHRENLMINSKNQVVPKSNSSPRELRQRAAATAAAHADKAGTSKVGMSDDEIKNAFKGGESTAPAGAPEKGLASMNPVDPSTVRQPVAPVSDGKGAKDFQGNPASDSRPPVGTPAEMRQMTRDASTGRTVSTSGTTGLTPSTDGGRPTQAADFRRSISSKYGTGSNVTRQPGQAPGTLTDPQGRTVPAGQWTQEQEQVQNTKYGPQSRGDLSSPAAIRQSAAASTPTSAGPVGMSRQDINSAFSAPLPESGSSGPVGMSRQDINSAFGASTPSTFPATTAPGTTINDTPGAASSRARGVSPNLPATGAAMSPASIRQSAAGSLGSSMADLGTTSDQKALADAKKKIKEADPDADPEQVIQDAVDEDLD